MVTTMHEEKDDNAIDSEHYDLVFEKEETSKCVVTLSKSVEGAFVYAKLLAQLRNLPLTCTSVELRLSNFGGDCHQCVELFNAFKDCQVPVDVIVTAPSYSCGAILALCGNTLVLNRGSFLMFHNYSTFELGKGGEVTHAVTHWAEYFHNWMNGVLFPFLSKKEISRLKADGDAYVNWDDDGTQIDFYGTKTIPLKKRIKRHFRVKKENK